VRGALLARAARPVHHSVMSKSSIRGLILAFCLIPLAACQWRTITSEQDADLRAVFAQFQRGDLTGVEAAFDPEFRTPALHTALPFMQGMLPPGASEVQRLNAAVERDKQGRLNYGATYEYDFPGHGLLVQIEKRQDLSGRKTLTAFSIIPASQPHLAREYRFSLIGQTPAHYIFLVLVALAPALGLWGLVAMWRAPDLPRRWKPLWTLAMALGFMDLTMNWHDGSVVVQVARLHVLYVSAAKFGPLSPWLISTSLPLASIAFLLGYRPPKKGA
jgi:hypothetical protein